MTNQVRPGPKTQHALDLIGTDRGNGIPHTAFSAAKVAGVNPALLYQCLARKRKREAKAQS